MFRAVTSEFYDQTALNWTTEEVARKSLTTKYVTKTMSDTEEPAGLKQQCYVKKKDAM